MTRTNGNNAVDFNSVDAWHRQNRPVYWAALNVHRTHKNQPISFDGHLYLPEIYHNDDRKIVIRKATQIGISEWLIVYCLIKASEGLSIIYALPTGELRGRFVKNRVDQSIMYSPYYKSLLGISSDRKFAESVSLKHIGKGVIAFIGSNAMSAFTEFSADIAITDEYDKCDQDNIIMLPERLSASDIAGEVKVGNPSWLNYGIDAEFKKSDQKAWHQPCNSCGTWIRPDFYRHVIRIEDEQGSYSIRDGDWDRNSDSDIRLICDRCNKPFNRFEAGAWVPTTESDISGYHISKLFSSKVSISELIERYKSGLSNLFRMQRFRNGDLGLPDSPKGASINRDDIENLVRDYNMPQKLGVPNISIMGVDVGSVLHVRISEPLENGRMKAVFIGTARELKDLKDLKERYNVKAGVIDALPEGRFSKKVCAAFENFYRCYYREGKEDVVDFETKVVQVDRTQNLDTIMESVEKKTLLLPRDVMSYDEYLDHMTSSTRVFNQKSGKVQWVNSGPDHFFHAEGYCILANRIFSKLHRPGQEKRRRVKVKNLNLKTLKGLKGL